MAQPPMVLLVLFTLYLAVWHPCRSCEPPHNEIGFGMMRSIKGGKRTQPESAKRQAIRAHALAHQPGSHLEIFISRQM